MPKRTHSHELEDLSIVRLHKAFKEKGWTVEDLRKDYGEDLFVRLFNNGVTTPLSFFVQAKATDNLAKYLDRNNEVIRFGVETGHVRHWVRFAEPVFLTIWDSHSDKTHWVCIQDALKPRYRPPLAIGRGKTMRVSVPYRNLLNVDGLNRIEGITKLRFQRQQREEQGSDLLVEQLRKASGRKIEYNVDEGTLFIKNPSGGADVHMVGDLAKRLKEFSQKSGLSPQEFLSESIKLAWKNHLENPSDPEEVKRELEEMTDDRERRVAEED
jgi:hypothetical protein